MMQKAPADAGPVILIGGDSRAAKAIATRLVGRPVILVVRRTPGTGRVLVEDYTSVPAGLIKAGATVINCVGIAKGGAATLDQANVVVPQRWAIAARDAHAGFFVQLSSFSVYGDRSFINSTAPVEPKSLYGKSKAAAEHMLTELASDTFPVAMLRTPILVDGDGSDKLGSLISACRFLHAVPSVSPPVQRSMLSYDGLATCVAHLLTLEPQTRVEVLADPDPFTYEAVRQIAKDCGSTIGAVRLPSFVGSALRHVAPALAQRILSSSCLSNDINFAMKALPFERVEAIIRQAFVAPRRAR